MSLQLVQWATSSPSRVHFPARCVLPTAGPARRARLCVNVAAAFIGRPTMPTLPPAQVSFVGLFTYAWLSGRAFRRPRLVICHLLRLWEPRCTVGDRSPPSVSTSPRTFSLLCRGSMSLPACSFLRISSFFKQLPPSTLYIVHVIKTPSYSPRLLLSSSVCAGLSVLGV